MSHRGAFEQMAQARERAFLKFLPGDNAATLPESETVLRMMTQDLAWLLRLDDADFWKAVMGNASLCLALDAFLHYRQRPSDSHNTSHFDSATLKRLTQQYFFFILRLVKVPEKISTGELQRRTKWLYDQRVLDVPQIFDFCTLYGEENRDLVQYVIKMLFEQQPKRTEDLSAMMSIMLDNLFILQERCHEALAQIRLGNETGMVGWTDVLHYHLDICLNFVRLMEIFPPASQVFLKNGAPLLERMAHLHDILLPQFDRTLRTAGFAKKDMDEMLRQLHVVMLALEKTTFLLLKSSFLDDPVDDTMYGRKEVPVERGNEFMKIIMSIADLEESDASCSLLHRIAKRFQFGNRIIEAIEQGYLLLDDAQFDYLSMLVQTNARPRLPKTMTTSEKRPAVTEPSTSFLDHPDDIQRATLLSKIQDIKDVLPDHGDGFLERCLLEFNLDTEQVIARLLDGELPSSLSNLDPYMPLDSGERRPDLPSSSKAAENAGSRQTFFKQFLFPDQLGPGWNAKYNEKPPRTGDIKDWAKVKVGSRRPKVDKATAKVLDQPGFEIRQIVIRQANELLTDFYEDEYDDSYDDLGAIGGADGQADVEGDDSRHVPSKSNKPYYVKDGKIYNAPKEGAIAVSNLGSAKSVATNREEIIHGLGRGGNRSETSATEPPASSSQPASRGRGRRGRGRGDNHHHRKERNAKKHGM